MSGAEIETHCREHHCKWHRCGCEPRPLDAVAAEMEARRVAQREQERADARAEVAALERALRRNDAAPTAESHADAPVLERLLRSARRRAG